MKILGLGMGLAGVLLAGTANAVPSSALPGNVLFSSYQSTNSFDTNFIPLATGDPTSATPGAPDAQEFTSASTTTLGNITFRLSDATPTDGGSLLVYLVPNSGSGSGVLPLSSGLTLMGETLLGTISDTSIGTSLTNVMVSVDDTIAAGTYWIALVNGSDPNNGDGNLDSANPIWERAGDLSGLDIGNNLGNTDAGLYNAHVGPNGSTLKNATNGAFEMQINTVPEPASLALLGAGLTGLGFIRRRRTNKSVG